MQNIKFKVITEIDEAFLEAWQDLWKNSWNAHLFNSPRWFVTASYAFGIKKLLILAFYKGNELIAVCPLTRSRRFGIKVLATPGGRYADKSPILIRQKDDAILKSFLDRVFSLGDIYLPEVDAWMLDSLRTSHQHVLLDGPFVSPFIPKEPDLISFLNKRQLRKIRNESLEHKQDFRFEGISGEVNKISGIVFAIEAESSRRAHGKGSFTDNNLAKLFHSIIRFWPNEVSLDVMYFKGRPISYMLGVLFSNTYYALNTAYIDGYQYLIPGKMVVYHLLERLQNSGVVLFDFLRGTSRFKEDFTPFFNEQYDVYFSRSVLKKTWWWMATGLNSFFKESGVLYKSYLAAKKQVSSFPRQARLVHA